jgi:DNA-binding transcriptional LysR family regulator
MESDNNPLITSAVEIPEYIIRHTTLRQFQIFEAIVRLGSFTRAAEELFLTQPTVSMQTKKLSDSIGLPLLEQVGRRVQPTEAGRALYISVRTIFQTLSNVEMAVSDLKGVRRGRLRLGVVTTAKYIAPRLMGGFSDEYPGVELALKVSNRERVVDRMLNGVDDLYIMGQVPSDLTDIESHPFAPNPLVVIAPQEHPWVGRKEPVTIEELAEHPLILRETGSGIRDTVLRLFEEKGLRPNVRMEMGSNEAIKHAVVAGLGVSIISLHTITLEGPKGPVAIVDVEQFPIMKQWFIAYPKSKDLSLVAKTFLDYAINYEASMRKALMNVWPMVCEKGKLDDLMEVK